MMAPVPLPANGRCGFGEGTFAGTPRERARCADSGPSRPRPRTGRFDPKQTFRRKCKTQRHAEYGHWEFTGPRGYKLGFSEISLINSLSSRRTCCARLITNGALLKEVLHWSPICFDPSARMTVKSVRRYADLSEPKLCAAIQLAQVNRYD